MKQLNRFDSYDVHRLYSIAHLLPKTARCGIYVLCFANGERYVGQSVDVVNRFCDHQRRWDDIESLLFSPCRRDALDEHEVATIESQRAQGFALRNITHALGPLGECDLDPLITPSEQFAWLNTDEPLPDVAERADDPEQRAKRRDRYRELEQSPHFGYVALIVNLYVQFTIPKPRETERTFWALSALPGTNRSRAGGRLATLSINKMETLFLFAGSTPELGDYVGGVINVSRSALEASAGPIKKLRKAHPNLDFKTVDYESAGGDALSVTFLSEGFVEALQIPGFEHAARQLNMMLMRKGPTFQWRWHCYDLADWAVRDVVVDDIISELEERSA